MENIGIKVAELAKEYPRVDKVLVLVQTMELLHHYAYNIESPAMGREYLNRQQTWVFDTIKSNLDKGLYQNKKTYNPNQLEIDLQGGENK